jgi:hypothetical protein
VFALLKLGQVGAVEVFVYFPKLALGFAKLANDGLDLWPNSLSE